MGISFPPPFAGVAQLNKAQLYKPVITSYLPAVCPKIPSQQTTSAHESVATVWSWIRSVCFLDVCDISSIFIEFKVCRDGGFVTKVLEIYSPLWCTGGESKRKCLTFTPSEAPHSPDIWVAHMKGTLVVGQRADSAAGYCPSNTLRCRENIVIHLHLFSSQPGKHSHKHKLVET